MSHMESGETLLSLGRVKEAFAELKKAEEIAPELHAQVRQIMRGRERGARSKRQAVSDK
jgi:hypothetical protein